MSKLNRSRARKLRSNLSKPILSTRSNLAVLEFSALSSFLLRSKSMGCLLRLVNQCLNRLPTHSSLIGDSRHCRRRTFLTIFSAISVLAFVSHSSSAISVLCKLNEKCTRQVNQFENELGSLLCYEKNCTVITFFRSVKYD